MAQHQQKVPLGIHRKNLLFKLAEAIREKADQMSLTEDQAFNQVAAEWLGYTLDENAFVDGAGDRGIDFWFQSEGGFDIFQVKSHDLQETMELDISRFNNEGVLDLERVRGILLTEDKMETVNDRLKQFRHQWDHAVSARRLANEPQPILVNLGLVLLGDGLTGPAFTEFNDFCRLLKGQQYLGNVPIEFRATLIPVDTLLEKRWRLDNREWRTVTGAKKDSSDFHPEKVDEALITKESALFYCRAIDLVRAYQEFGYQIFEPNVRCNITMSDVNAAIRKSVQHRPTREEFRFLNNGVTIICAGYTKPSQHKPYFRVIQPGVVNGLQTIFALHEAYGGLLQEEKEHFEQKCFVLVRLLERDALRDVNRIVIATNTQNPMQPRNLVSNDAEQILFEQLFADMGWFYERKQGAWEAFASNPRQWRSLHNKKAGDFQVRAGVGRPRIRKVDNEVLAQTRLSFIGFSEEAVHSKRGIFENRNWYDFIFLHTPSKHGHDFQYKLDDAIENYLNDAPDPAVMLAAFLAREFARKISPTPKENREIALKRLKVDTQSTLKEEVDAQLVKDTEFVLGQVTNGMSFVFVEFLGLLLFKSLEEELSSVGQMILKNGSMSILSQNLNYDEVCKSVADQKFKENDLLAVSWWVFRHVLEEMVGGSWIESYHLARNRTRFNHSRETRERLHKGLMELHRFTERTQLTRVWATGIRPPNGLFGFVRDTLLPIGHTTSERAKIHRAEKTLYS